jgi:DNA-binding transcriptional LysR family regulator
MGETKGTVSRRITRLERSLGVTLLRRSPRSVAATDDGTEYRMHVGRVLELLGDANVAVRRLRAAPSGHLRVTAPTDLAIGVLASKVAGFAARYPEVRLEMVVTDKVLDMDAEHIDVSLRAAVRLPDSQRVAYKLLDVDLVAVASPAYVAAHGAPARVADLCAHRILYLGSTRGRQKLALRRPGAPRPSAEVEVRPAIGSTDFYFVKEVALAGGGVAFVPHVIVAAEIAAGRLTRLFEDYVVSGAALYLLHRGERFLQPKVRAFVTYMLEAFGVQGGAALTDGA